MGTAQKLFNLANSGLKSMMRTQERVRRGMKVINESLDIARNSPNPETRISRMQVAIDRLAHMEREFPLWPDCETWVKQRKELLRNFPNFYVNNISSLIKIELEKIDKIKSYASKHNKVNKLIEKLEKHLNECGDSDKWLRTQISLLSRKYPANVQNADSTIQIPTNWSLASPIVYSNTEESPRPEPIYPQENAKKTVGWLRKVAIWILWLGILETAFPKEFAHKEFIILAGSFFFTYFTIKAIALYHLNKK